MPPSTTFDEPPEFDVGDRVVTVDPIGLGVITLADVLRRLFPQPETAAA